jgi:hypothetical protein
MKCTVLDVSGTNVTFQQFYHLKNGTERSVIGLIDISTGHSNASNSFMICPYIVISANLTPAEPIFTEVYPYNQWQINSTISRTYIGIPTEVNFVRVSNSTHSFLTHLYFAKDTGILYEFDSSVYDDYYVHGSVVASYRAEPRIWVNPSFTSLTHGQNLTVTICVGNVLYLRTWGVYLIYNGSVLNFTNAWIPEDNVFAGKLFAHVPPFVGDTHDGNKYLEYGSFLASSFGKRKYVNVTEGVLFKANFTALENGNTTLLISTGSYLFDPDTNEIPYAEENGQVEVIPEFQSILIIPLIMITTMLTAIVRKRKYNATPNQKH